MRRRARDRTYTEYHAYHATRAGGAGPNLQQQLLQGGDNQREEHFGADLDRSACGGRAENAACSVQHAAGRMRHERLSVAARARLRARRHDAAR